MEWIRLYKDILDDPKISKLSDFSYKIFTFLLLFCAENENSGRVFSKFDEICWRFREKKSKIKSAFSELQDVGIIRGWNPNDKDSPSYNSPIIIVAWEKRQYKSDNVNERVKRYRQKNETLRETLHVTKGNVSRNVIDTDTDTDTETDTEKKETSKEETATPDGAAITPSEKKPDVRISPGESLRLKKADEILAVYAAEVKPPELDQSQQRAKGHIAALLKRGFRDDSGNTIMPSAESLLQSVRNYAVTQRTAGHTDPQFNFNVGNFFGRDRIFIAYMPDVWKPPRQTPARIIDQPPRKEPVGLDALPVGVDVPI